MYDAKFLIESTCPVCGKIFIPAPQHAYSVNIHKKNGYTKKVPICSWSCLRKTKRSWKSDATRMKKVGNKLGAGL